MSQASFNLRGRNPDVLTCIANLSNDEVFTPPELANEMLDQLSIQWAKTHDGQDIWSDPTVRFLDPFTKTGIFLREIVTRLNLGLEDTIPNLEARVEHIMKRQVFGIAVTELTALISRRSVYCSKLADGPHSIARTFDSSSGNIWFERTEHSWEGGNQKLLVKATDGRLASATTNGKCKFCGANQRDYERGQELETHAYRFIHTENLEATLAEIFEANMRFDVIIGNPPYQLGQSGGDSVGGFAMPIYQKFVDAAKSLDPQFVVMITPSRWFAGGRGLDEFRSTMLKDKRMKSIVDFPNASDVFPGTQIKGGVSYFIWDQQWSGDCEFITSESGSQGRPMLRNLSEYDVLVRRNESMPILEKVLEQSRQRNIQPLAESVSPIQPFSLRTNFRGANTESEVLQPVKVYGNGGHSFINRSEIPRNQEWVDDWKVLIGRAYGAGDGIPHQIYNYPIIAEPGSACTETYLVVKRFNELTQAQAFGKFLQTKLVRFLVSLRKNTQDIYSDRFAFVPDLSMTEEWDDDRLFEFFGLLPEEIAFIDQMIRPMDAPVE